MKKGEKDKYIIRLCRGNIGFYKSRIQPSACGLGLYARFVKPDISSTEAYNYRKCGSASYIVREVLSVRERERERYRERERDGSDVTIVALKLAMNSHFPLPKIRTIGDELTLSLAKNSHFSFLPSHFLSLPSRRGHHCGAEIRNEFTLSIAKKFFALFVPPLLNGTSRATSDRKPKSREDKWSNPAQSYFVLPIEKMNQINTKNYWK